MCLRPRLCFTFSLFALAFGVDAQDLNIDFGAAGTPPAPTYGAAGQPGVWNAIPAAHGTTTNNLVDVSGGVTAVSISQIGGLALLDDNDPAVSGDDALLLDDFLVTYNAGLESCIYLNSLAAGVYEVWIYARMPDAAVGSYTSVDQEPDTPHWTVGGLARAARPPELFLPAPRQRGSGRRPRPAFGNRSRRRSGSRRRAQRPPGPASRPRHLRRLESGGTGAWDGCVGC